MSRQTASTTPPTTLARVRSRTWDAVSALAPLAIAPLFALHLIAMSWERYDRHVAEGKAAYERILLDSSSTMGLAGPSIPWDWLEWIEWLGGWAILLMMPLVLAAVIYDQYADPWSTFNRTAWRILPRNRLARGAARRIEAEWQRLSIEPTGYWESPNGMTLTLPGGAGVTVKHNVKGATEMVLTSADGRREHLGATGRARVMQAIERRQIDVLAELLDVAAGHTPESMAAIVSERLKHDPRDTPGAVKEGMSYRRTYRMTVAKGIDAAMVSSYMDRPKNDDHSMGSPEMLIVRADGIGVLRLPAGDVLGGLRRKRRERLESDFQVERKAAPSAPTIIGNARASRLADVAGRALQEHPDLADANGARIDALLSSHLPRLLQRHRDATRTADTSAIAGIDADLDRGLDAIAASIGEALDRVATGARDELRTEVRFLEARRGEAA